MFIYVNEVANDMMVVKSADRVIQILEAVASNEHGMTHGEISKTLEIPKGSLTFLLANLAEREYLSFDRMVKVYKLGPGLLVLAGRYLSNLDIVRVGRPVMRELVKEINEDIELAIAKNDEALFVYKEECSQPLKYYIEIGDRAPLYATASGKAILAHLTEEEISRFLSLRKLVALRSNTITDENALRDELESIRSKGLAYSREEFQEGISAIAAPIFNLHGSVVGAIVVTLPSVRFNAKHMRFIEPRLLSAARMISHQFGFEPSRKEALKTVRPLRAKL
jgi:DNA-binding IclR family transcriptional regulator